MSNLTDETAIYKDQLDQWIKSLGIPQYNPPNDEIETILSFTRDTLRERSSIQLAEDSVLLAGYALFIQQKNNECGTFLIWSKQIANHLSEDDHVKLNKWIQQAKLRIERISYLNRRLELVGQSIGNLVRARYNER